MKKWQQVSAIMIISTSLLSNIVLADQYRSDTNKLEKKIQVEKELIKSNNSKFNNELSQKQGIINKQQQDINSKSKEINDVNSQLNQIKNENDNLKKQL
jgi:septal ring factor EnvC (AmiA/AmiB activator)